MTNHALVLTGEVLPGFTPISVWPHLAGYLRMEPEKLMQLLARAPLTIKSGADPAPLQTLQADIAAIGGAAELYQPDERPALFVVIDGSARGPLPRALAEQRVRQGLWPDSISATEAGSSGWKPYRQLDASAIAAPPPPNLAMPAPPSALPAGEAIHAGFWRRLAALLIDYLVLFVPLFIPLLGLFAFFPGKWLYFALMESSGWQATLGKRAMGIKVTDQFGQRIGFGRATGRYFGAFLSQFLFLIGYMMAAFTPRKQALHDIMAGTLVVFDAVQPNQPAPTQRPPMPWYGWVVLVFLLFVPLSSILAAIALPAYDDYSKQAQVTQVIDAAAAIKAEIADKGCQPGARPPPSSLIETAEVKTAAASGACTIELTFGQSANVPHGLRGNTIDLTSGQDGQWTCSSSLPVRYQPQSCRQ